MRESQHRWTCDTCNKVEVTLGKNGSQPYPPGWIEFQTFTGPNTGTVGVNCCGDCRNTVTIEEAYQKAQKL